MSFSMHPHQSKIPGGGLPVAKRENHVKDLTKLTRIDLFEIKERQEMLLSNKSKLNRLPDKGKRIKDFYEKVLLEVERRNNIDEAAAMFSELNIAEKGQETLNQLEWNGRLQDTAIDPAADVLDSDDEIDLDPLRVIAQRQMHERRLKILPSEPQLITADDLADIKSFAVDAADAGLDKITGSDSSSEVVTIDADLVEIGVKSKLINLKHKSKEINEEGKNSSSNKTANKSTPQLDQHMRYLMKKAELAQQPEHVKFLPYKTTKTDVHAPEKERARKQGKYWEVTAATPPPIQHSGTQLLTLLDSVEIQTNYLAKLKVLQEEHAAARLAIKIERLQNHGIKIPTTEELKHNKAFSTYRTTSNQIEGIPQESEADEVFDPLDLEQTGGAVGIRYTIVEDKR